MRTQLRSAELAGLMGTLEEAIDRWDADPGSRPAEQSGLPVLLLPQPGDPLVLLKRLGIGCWGAAGRLGGKGGGTSIEIEDVEECSEQAHAAAPLPDYSSCRKCWHSSI